MDGTQIRNFGIIAHIDHGKSTLADRMLEITGTVEGRKMQEQVLDQMELERERGITIKMTPVRMEYCSRPGALHSKMRTHAHVPACRDEPYTLNLIDTPGHVDFSYEVSRALKAVEGVLFLVDATQGVQAQTISVLQMAREADCVVIPVITKIDSKHARIDEVSEELVELTECNRDEIFYVSGKTGEGVWSLLDALIEKIPPPKETFDEGMSPQALVFDFEYSIHRGVLVYVRLFNGEITKGDQLIFSVTGERFRAQEVGIFAPDLTPQEKLGAGEVGYIVTGIKELRNAFVGDTIVSAKHPLGALSGYQNPLPVVWASFYPESQDDFPELWSALSRLKLTDSSLSFEEETSPSLGKGFRCGFLGMLHLEIVSERLRREYGLSLVTTTPSVTYDVSLKDGTKKTVYTPDEFPEYGNLTETFEPWVEIQIISPSRYIDAVIKMVYQKEGEIGETRAFGSDRVVLMARMPLREFMAGFFDEIKRVSSGFASFAYENTEKRKADVVRLQILVAEEEVPALARVISRDDAYREAKRTVERLYEVLPRQLFPVKIQGKAMGRILASKTLPALKKDVTGHLYGGDITRKRKLWEKQKKGKKKLKERGRVEIPSDVFLKMMKE